MLLELNVDLASIILAGFAAAWVCSALGDAMRFIARQLGGSDDPGM